MKLHLLLFLLFVTILSNAQDQKSLWLASVNTFKLHNKISLLLDLQYRTSDKLRHTQTIIIRPAMNYHISKSAIITTGYAYIPSRRTVAGSSAMIPEQRLWQQFSYVHNFTSSQLSHRLRFEERFIPRAFLNGPELEKGRNQLTYRFRYFLRYIKPIGQDMSFSKGFFFALQNETFLNVANQQVTNGKTFDQNRGYFALAYRYKKMDFEAGYLNQYVQGSATKTINHVAQVIIYKRL